MSERPFVGVAVILKRDEKVLLGKRRNAHGSGTWALPGGHLEFGESIEACAKREVLEETGLKIEDVRHAAFTNDVFKTEEKHYITLFVTAKITQGEPEVKEPYKCEKWDWFTKEQLPAPLFLSLQHLLEQGDIFSCCP